jgi:hypothetical protein
MNREPTNRDLITQETFDALRLGAEVLEQDRHGIKVMLLSDGDMLKLFRIKRCWSSARWWPYSRRFCRNAIRLALLGIPTVTVKARYALPDPLWSAVRYQPLPGKTLRQIGHDEGLNAGMLRQFGAFVAILHRQGIYFRSLHLGNVVWTPESAFGLIDIADLSIRWSALGMWRRVRNFRHICRLETDRILIGEAGWHQFLEGYVNESGQAVDPHQLMSRAQSLWRS